VTARKSPLRSSAPVAASHHPYGGRVVSSEREDVVEEYADHLTTTTNRFGRPFSPKTVKAYLKSVYALDRWLTETGRNGDFAEHCNVSTLNTFFRAYYMAYDMPKSPDGKGGYTGGTNTLQRNLRPFLVWLSEEFDIPDVHADKKYQRYSAPKAGKPKTLSEDFVGDMLKATGNGRAKDFETVRNHAIVRVLTEGLRAEELLRLDVDHLDLPGGLLYVVPLKGDRNSKDTRAIPLQPSTVKALRRYLRYRASHKMAKEAPVWLGTRNRARLTYSGLYRLVKRLAEAEGYDPKLVSPHSYCHTWCDDLLSRGVSGQNVMTIRGWKSPAMLQRYGADQATVRAVAAVSALGDRY
jgi:site-specific recombinase XerD